MDLVSMDEESRFQPDYEECEDLEVTETPRSAKPTVTPKHHSRNKRCLLCSRPTTHPRRHIVQHHLPWWFQAASACCRCCIQEGSVGPLKARHQHQGEELPDISAWMEWATELVEIVQETLGFCFPQHLLDHVLKNKWFAKEGGFNETERAWLRQLSVLNKWGLPSGPITVSPPNCIAALLHFKTFAVIISILCPAAQQSLARFQPAAPSKLNLVDSHAHLDILISRSQMSIPDWDRKFSDSSVKVSGIITNYVYPEHWASSSALVSNPRVKATFGLHPQMVVCQGLLNPAVARLKRYLQQPNCFGLGEVGLEYTNTSRRSQRLQRTFLRDILSEWKTLNPVKQKLVVLHSRDNGNGSAARDIAQILRDLEMERHPFHRHSFSGSLAELEVWLKEFPNCYFGLSTTIFWSEATQVAVANLPLNWLLLESDSPYLSPSPWEILPFSSESQN